MSKFEKTLNKYYQLLEFQNAGTYGQAGSTAINPDASPIRPLPGMMDTGDMEKDIVKTPILKGTPREIAKLQQVDNEGGIRVIINKLANKIPLTQAEQETVNKLKFISKNGGQEKPNNPLNPEVDKEPNLSKTVVSDDVEQLNNPNRPRLSYAQV